MIGRKNGVVIIDKAVGQFKTIVTQLTSGLALVEEQHKNNAQEIDSLTAENHFLDRKIEQASIFRNNLIDMLGEKAPVEGEIQPDPEKTEKKEEK